MATTPLKAIKAKCLDCSCGSYTEVKECPITDCSLYPFRLGHNPNIKLTDEQRAKRAEIGRQNMAKLLEKQGAAST